MRIRAIVYESGTEIYDQPQYTVHIETLVPIKDKRIAELIAANVNAALNEYQECE